MAEKREYTKKEKEAFAAKKKAEFDNLVKIANDKDSNPLSREVAKQVLKKKSKQADTYLRKNEPAKYAEKLREKAKYYDEKAKKK